jgi:hypothetical protein
MTQAGLSTAVAWAFTQLMLPDAVGAGDCPVLAAYSVRAESLPAFLAAPQV